MNTKMPTAADAKEEEDYAVYSCLIDSWYVNKAIHLIVIEDQTDLQLWGEKLEDWVADLPEILPGGTTELVQDFVNNNKQSHLLKPLFVLKVPYVFITSREMDDIFQIVGGEGWDEFYRRYPGSHGTITLSRPGFNAVGNQSLVYIGNQVDWRAGSGHRVFLIKEEGAWKILSKTMI